MFLRKPDCNWLSPINKTHNQFMNHFIMNNFLSICLLEKSTA